MKQLKFDAFVEDEKLSTKEFISKLGISMGTWKANRKDILIQFGNVFEYEVEYEGRSTFYHIIKRVNEVPATRDEAFERAILTTLYFQPMNTAANVARIIQKDEEQDIAAMGYADGTVYEYTKSRMRKWFGNNENDRGDFEDMEDMKERKGFIEEKVWCMLDAEYNDYIEMSQEQIDYFMKSIKDSFKTDTEMEVKLLADYDAGVISKSELDKALGDLKVAGYAAAKKAFRAKYGKFPIKVPVYKIYESKLPKELRN